MIVMIIYVLLVAVGEVAAFLVAHFVDPLLPASWSMIFYMTLFFGVIALMWPIAVWITEKWFVSSESVKGEVVR